MVSFMTIEVLEQSEVRLPNPSFVKGTGRAYGTSGHLLFGSDLQGQRFSVPLPLQAVSTCELRLRPVKERSVRGLEFHPQALSALNGALDSKGLDNVEVVVKMRTMIPSGRGLREADADTFAVLAALWSALEIQFSRKEIIAQSGVSFLAALPERLSVLRFEDGRSRPLSALPRFSYVYLAPAANPARDGFFMSKTHEESLTLIDTLDKVTIEDIADASTRNARLSCEASPHMLSDFLFDGMEGLLHAESIPQPLGISVSADTHGACLLYPHTFEGRNASTAASYALRRHLGSSYFYGVSTTHAQQQE